MRLPQWALHWRGTRWLLLFTNLAAASFCIATLWHGPATRALLSTAARSIDSPPPIMAPVLRALDTSSIQSAALFHTSRSFYVPPPAIATVSPPDYRLAATWMLPNGPPAALVTQNRSGAHRKIRVGDELEGWAVSTIDSHAVLLHHGEQRHEISMQRTTAAGLQAVSTPTSAPASTNPPRGRITLLGQPLAPTATYTDAPR